LRPGRIVSVSLLAASLIGACGPDWDALDPSLGGGSGPIDCPTDGNDCTADVCENGIPKYTPVELGMPCSNNGGSVCNAIGQCVECNVAGDCPGTDDDCQTRACSSMGTCGVTFQPKGQPVVAQTPGDCMQNVCNGMGGVELQIDDDDKPVDPTECTADLCMAGVPKNSPIAIGEPCNEGGGEVCNGAGACVQCNVPSDCGMSVPCVTFTCNAGMCPTNANDPPGTMCGGTSRCDGKGGCLTCQPANGLLFTSSDTPLVIDDSLMMGVTSSVFASSLGTSIVDVNVTVTITMSDASGDLVLTLVSPKGTMIDLTSNNGGLNDNNFVGTMFDDDSNNGRITETTFVNNMTVVSAIPERNLGLLNGENPNGTWLLVAKDTGPGFVDPILTSWSLSITAQDGNFPLVTAAPFPSGNAAPIPDNGEVTSPVTVDTPGFITNATLTVDLPHKDSSQLVITLVTPSNKQIPLSTKNGKVDSFDGTTFDDAAASLVGCAGFGCVAFPMSGAVPAMIPEGSLSALIGESAKGTWNLKVTDTANGQTGTLNSWTLNLTTALCPLTP
jgi:subtilisin-like proprotein convertase family protein